MHNRGTTTRLSIALVLLAAVTWCGCARMERLYGVKPAEVPAERILTLAILRFDGPYGETVRSHVRERLAGVEDFRAIDAAQVSGLDSATYETVDDPRFFPAIEKLKADVVLAGQITARIHDVPGTDQVELREGTGHYKKERDLTGRWVDVEIMRAVVRPVPYITRQASVSIEYKVFDVKTRQVIDTGSVKEIYDEKFGGDREHAARGHKLSDLPAEYSTVDELADRLAGRLAAKIETITKTRKIENTK